MPPGVEIPSAEAYGKAVVLLTLAVLIYRQRILDYKGTIIAIAMGGSIIYLAGFSWFLLLLTFLLLGYGATKYKYEYKESLKLAEANKGRRSAANVLANGLVPTFFAVLWYTDGARDLAYVAGYIAAIATVTGDTLSSEIGVLSKKHPVLITTLEKVPPGTDGGISLLGELVGIVGAFLIGISAWFFGVIPSPAVALLSALIGGMAGFHIDSLLGAVLERRGLCGNATVNFLSAIAGGMVGLFSAALVL